jgi:hypothetical protein
VVNDSFRSAVGLWRHGDIYAGDLGDLHIARLQSHSITAGTRGKR